jgi:hypothetical protein
LEDAASIAALTQSLLHYLYRSYRDHRVVPVYSRWWIQPVSATPYVLIKDLEK